MRSAELQQGDARSGRQEVEGEGSPGILDRLHSGLLNCGGLKKNVHLKQRECSQSQ